MSLGNISQKFRLDQPEYMRLSANIMSLNYAPSRSRDTVHCRTSQGKQLFLIPGSIRHHSLDVLGHCLSWLVHCSVHRHEVSSFSKLSSFKADDFVPLVQGMETIRTQPSFVTFSKASPILKCTGSYTLRFGITNLGLMAEFLWQVGFFRILIRYTLW